MPSTPNEGRARRVSPEMERERLRRQLINLYAADKQYQAIVQRDLEPLWRLVQQEDAGRATAAFRSATASESAQGPGQPSVGHHGSDMLANYEAKVRAAVKDRLGLSVNGQPPRWASSAVHAHVASPQSFLRPPIGAREFPPLRVPVIPDVDLAVRLTVWPTFVKAELVRDDHVVNFALQSTEDVPVDLLEVDLSDDFAAGHGSEEWARLEHEALEALRAGIAEIRARFEEAYPVRYAARTKHQQEDLAGLFASLFYNRAPADRATAERLRRLAQVLGLDYPKPRRRKSSTRFPHKRIE